MDTEKNCSNRPATIGTVRAVKLPDLYEIEIDRLVGPECDRFVRGLEFKLQLAQARTGGTGDSLEIIRVEIPAGDARLQMGGQLPPSR
jgi:hypothetical protein